MNKVSKTILLVLVSTAASVLAGIAIAAYLTIPSIPLISEGDRLLVMVGGQPNAGMVAFDAATGKTLWESVGAKNKMGGGSNRRDGGFS